MNNNIEIAVVVNSFNRIELLKKSLGSLLKELDGLSISFAVVVFDAGSTDGSTQWIQNWILENPANRKLVYARNGEDTSFSNGVNIACTYALENFQSVKYFLLYETDNFLKSPQAIKYSKNLLDQCEEIAACGYTVKKHNTMDAGYGASFPSLLSFVLGKQFSHFLKLDRPVEKWIKKNDFEYSNTDIVYTSPLLIRKEVWEKLKGFDYQNFPFSDCDIDLAYRIHKLGKKMAVIKTSEVIHDNLQTQSTWSDTRTIREYRARFIYFRKHYGNIVYLFKPFLLVMHVFELMVLFILMLSGKRKCKSLETRWFLIKRVLFNYC